MKKLDSKAAKRIVGGRIMVTTEEGCKAAGGEVVSKPDQYGQVKCKMP
jgi:phosphoribosylaminoimidazole (AIR) synthetase